MIRAFLKYGVRRKKGEILGRKDQKERQTLTVKYALCHNSAL